MIKNFKKTNSGYTLLEIIFYTIFFAAISIAVINTMITMTRAFKETTVQAELLQGGNIMERMSREIKQANNINLITMNDLKLNTTDTEGANKIVEFSFSDPNIRLLENDVFIGNLNTQNITVINLAFTQIDTAKGSAVKMLLTVKSNRDSQNRTESFYNTIVLRGNY